MILIYEIFYYHTDVRSLPYFSFNSNNEINILVSFEMAVRVEGQHERIYDVYEEGAIRMVCPQKRRLPI